MKLRKVRPAEMIRLHLKKDEVSRAEGDKITVSVEVS